MLKSYLPTLTFIGTLIAIGTYAQVASSASDQQTAKSIATGLGMYVFPAEGQDQSTQDNDEITCYKWAMEQTGVDPINPPQIEAEQAQAGPDGSAVRGAARGAAAGAAIGAIAGDAGQGAAIGAVVGGLGGRRGRIARGQTQQARNEQAAAKQEEELMNNFKKAFSACLEGKGYTVK